MYSSTILNIILCLFLLDLSDFALVLRVKFFLDFRFSLLTFLLSKLDRVNPHDIGVPISACCWCGRISIGRGNGEAGKLFKSLYRFWYAADCRMYHITCFPFLFAELSSGLKLQWIFCCFYRVNPLLSSVDF